MFNKESFRAMYELQNQLNINTNGEDWVDGVTKDMKTINWFRCISQEAAEGVDSFPAWKHWKDIEAPDDIANAKIELVDIWHFIMSQHIREKGIDDATNEAMGVYLSHKLKTNLKTIECFETIMFKSLQHILPLVDFFEAVDSIKDFSMEDVFSIYIGKNTLNQFRQDNGYKEGSYIKMWDGKEDNVYLTEIINSLEADDIRFETVYNELRKRYALLTEKAS